MGDREIARVTQPASNLTGGAVISILATVVFGLMGLSIMPQQWLMGCIFVVCAGGVCVASVIQVVKVRGDQTMVLYEDRIEVMNGDQTRTYPLESVTSIDYDDRWNGQKPLIGSKTYFVTTKSGIINMPQTDEGLEFARKLADLVKFGYP